MSYYFQYDREFYYIANVENCKVIIRGKDKWINATYYTSLYNKSVENFAKSKGLNIKDHQIFKTLKFVPLAIIGTYINPRWFHYLKKYCEQTN